MAPIDGLVVYGNPSGRYSEQPDIEVGATVGYRRMIVTIVDLSRIRVLAQIPESHVDKLSPNMKAKIRVDAFTDEVWSGTVLDVAPRPDRAAFVRSDVKVYPTHIQIDDPISGLRPGMTASAEILVKELDNVLSVPISAVLMFDGKDHVAVKKPGGGFEWRDVVLGIANDEQVEVKEGIKDHDAVIINPSSLMSEEERKAKFGAPPRVTLPAGSTPSVKRAEQQEGGRHAPQSIVLGDVARL